VKSGVIDVSRHLHQGIRIFYEGRHSTLIIFLQP
jgi:putative component of toxin-antitoxin plasmid stabilization module